MKKYLPILLGMITFVGMFSNVHAEEAKKLVVITQDAVVYEEASKGAKEITETVFGEILEYISYEDGWYEVSLEVSSQKGYMQACDLIEEPLVTMLQENHEVYAYGKTPSYQIGDTSLEEEYILWQYKGNYWIIMDNGKIGILET